MLVVSLEQLFLRYANDTVVYCDNTNTMSVIVIWKTVVTLCEKLTHSSL